MLFYLLTAQNDEQVAYEVWDDVTVIKKDGHFLVEQITSAQSNNPLTDTSPKPWHTIANWVRGAKAGSYDAEKADFILYVLQSNPLGNLLKALQEANSIEKAKIALDTARIHFWGASPSYPKRQSVAQNKKENLEVIFGADQNIICNIIKNFKVVTGNSDPETELKEAVANTHFSPNVQDDLLNRTIGWLKRKKDGYLAEQKRCIVSRKELLVFLNQMQRSYDSSSNLNYVLDEPSENEAQTQVSRSPMYIKQLEIIELRDSDKIGAAKDFLKSSAFSTKMAASGEYSADHFEKFDADLLAVWDAKRLAIEDPAATDVVHGKRLYGNCRLEQNVRILDKYLPAFFIAGSFHRLANAALDKLEIG